ncbi:NfeD family protein [Salidesulfovibrio brasiliensis]
MRRLLLFVVVFVVMAASSAFAEPFRVVQVDLTGAVSPAQEELLNDSLSYCSDNDIRLLLIRLDTPGGLGESMRNMVKAILNSPVPVAVWVGPSGARATSAGVFIVAASDVAGMAPYTTIGAASPVSLGGDDIEETMQMKIKNDFVSLLKSVASRRGRNIEWYASSVETAASITAEEAAEMKVVEIVAPSVPSFLDAVGERGISHMGQTITFAGDQVVLETFDPGIRYSILSWLLHPQIAYFLLLGGMIGLFIEITHPGTVFPGVLGGICLLLALYALSILPTSVTGVLLILFALLLLGLEVSITSFGLLTVAGAVSLFMGGMLLFRDPYGYLHIPVFYILIPSVVFSAFISVILWLVIRSRKTRYIADGDTIVGMEGNVIRWDGRKGQIRVRGEIWAATASQGDFVPSPGLRVRISGRSGLTAEIEPLGSEPTNTNG